jgi:hypothetical protein
VFTVIAKTPFWPVIGIIAEYGLIVVAMPHIVCGCRAQIGILQINARYSPKHSLNSREHNYLLLIRWNKSP